MTSDQHFSFKCFPENAFPSKIFSKIVRPVLATLSVNGLITSPVFTFLHSHNLVVFPSAVWNIGIFDNNFEINHRFSKYSKEGS